MLRIKSPLAMNGQVCVPVLCFIVNLVIALDQIDFMISIDYILFFAQIGVEWSQFCTLDDNYVMYALYHLQEKCSGKDIQNLKLPGLT